MPTVTRKAVEAIKVGSHTIPKGSTIMINIQAVHHDAKLWPDPMKFDPTRFCDPSPRPKPYTFIPFIEGPRNCLGQYLALLESKMVLSMLLQRYSFALQGDETGEPRHPYMVPVIPKTGVFVSVKRKF